MIKKAFKAKYFLLAVILVSISCNDIPVYKDPLAPVEERVADLLSRMTLEEKVAQLRCIYRNKQRIVHTNKGIFDPQLAKKNLVNGIGHIARPSELGGIDRVIRYTNAVQKYLMDSTRLGIPAIFHEEGLHGFAADSATVYPSATALASTWNIKLVEQVFASVAQEIRSRGGNQVLSPVLDVARDPRWGRFEETYGEDPYLVSQMAIAAINGFQGDTFPIPNNKVIATMKHFVAHGQPESGINIAPPNATDQVLNEVHMYPFYKAVTNTKVLSVMASYNEVNGIPLHANPYLLEEMLRDKWNFKGAVVSDYGGIDNLIDRHRVAKDEDEAAILAISSGVDIELPDDDVYDRLEALVREEKIDEKTIDNAVSRVLTQKFLLGLFENPFTKSTKADILRHLTINKELAEEAAIQSITLLENNGVLPIKTGDYNRISVIGPNANYTVFGGYSGVPLERISPLQGIKQKMKGKVEVSYRLGCKITASEPNWRKDEVIPVNPEDERKLIRQAVLDAKKSDLIILCLGDNESVSREAWSERHLGDRPSIKLVGLQEELFDGVKALNKPIVVLLFTNGPRDLSFLKGKADAVLQCWYLGQQCGNAVAKILTGERNPSGKLVTSFPRSVGHIPAFYNYKPSARRGYMFDDVTPLYPFGYGLSYTTIEYTQPNVSDSIISVEGETDLFVKVRNTGEYTTDEVVMLFVRDEIASVTRPVKELKAFKKVRLKPGESRIVQFSIDAEMLSFYHPVLKEWICEPGNFKLMVGVSGQEALLTVTE